MESEKIVNNPIEDENRTSNFHVIKIKAENNKDIWGLYEPDFKELQKLCISEFSKIKIYANIYSFFGKFSYLIISLASLLNSGLAMVDEYKIIIIILTYFITFISIINSAFSFEKKAEELYFISKEYENISYKIKHLLYNNVNLDKDPEYWYDLLNNEIDVLDTLYFNNINRVKKSLNDFKKN